MRAAQNGCCRGRRIEAKKEIQVAIINSCVRFLPGARPSLFPTKKKRSSTFSALRFFPLLISLIPYFRTISPTFFPSSRPFALTFGLSVCVGLRTAGDVADSKRNGVLRYCFALPLALERFVNSIPRAPFAKRYSRGYAIVLSLLIADRQLRGRGRWEGGETSKQLESIRKLMH